MLVVRACIGMAYPPIMNNNMPPVYREQIRPNEEPRNIIHFDMNPLNSKFQDI